MISYEEAYIPENQGKKYIVHCPNCKKTNLTGGTLIFVMCRDCLWVGQVYECLFSQKKLDCVYINKNERCWDKGAPSCDSCPDYRTQQEVKT